MVILITGGSGMTGSRLVAELQRSGHEVRILSRKAFPHICEVFEWDVNSGYIDPLALVNVDVVVHLAGASVADGRWTAKRKAEILSSRVDAALLLHKSLKDKNHQIKAFISASGAGYYGSRHNEIMDESSTKGYGFLPDVCELWEASALKFKDISKSVYVNRIGIVLSNDGGFMAKMKPLFRWRVASALGKGSQFTSWIHIDDLISIISKQIAGELKPGIYNAVSPSSIKHSSLMKALSVKYKSSIWLPNIPFIALRVIFGELAYELTADQNINPQKLVEQNFEFQYPKLEDALKSL